jgi:hypothetical protein
MRGAKPKGGGTTAPDPQEERALARAADAVARFGTGKPDTIAAVAISAWIIERTKLSASHRVSAELLFDLKDARMRGLAEAALPAIANTLGHIPSDAPLFALTKDVAMAMLEGIREAAVAANEALGFPFDDDIPFGEAA